MSLVTIAKPTYRVQNQGSILHFCLLWFSGKSPLLTNIYFWLPFQRQPSWCPCLSMLSVGKTAPAPPARAQVLRRLQLAGPRLAAGARGAAAGARGFAPSAQGDLLIFLVTLGRLDSQLPLVAFGTFFSL